MYEEDITSMTSCQEEFWYSVCYDYFTKGENKSALEWFQQLDSLDTDSNKDTNDPPNNNLTHEQIDFYKQCGIYVFSSQDEWYRFDQIKNRARSDMHLLKSQERLSALITDLHRHTATDANDLKDSITRTNAVIMSDLNRFLGQSGVMGAPIVWTLLDHVCLWINRCVS